MALAEELAGVAALASRYADEGETLVGVLAAEPTHARRVYVCAYERGEDRRTWLALDAEGEPLSDRRQVRDAVSIAALCELAAETAGGGDLASLRSELLALRLRDNPPGIDEAEDAALELERVLGAEPRVATAGYLDEVGAAARRLEASLGEVGRSPFALAMTAAVETVESLAAEVEGAYKTELR